MRLVILLAVLLLFPLTSSYSQSEWLDQDQSGVFLSGTYAWAENIDGVGGEIGWAQNGISDIGISLSKADHSYSYTQYFGPGEVYAWTREFSSYSTTQFFQAHMVKKPFGSRDQNRLMLTFSEQLSLIGDSFFDFTQSTKVLTLGGHAGCRLGPSPNLALLLSAGYFRSMVLNSSVSDDGLGIVAFRIGVAKYSATSVVSLNFALERSNGNNYYGLALSLGQIAERDGLSDDY